MRKGPRTFLLILSALTIGFSDEIHSQTSDASQLWIFLDDHIGDVATMYFGNATLATYCVDDGTGGRANYFEQILPAVCGGLIWCSSWKGVRTSVGNACLVDGLFPRDYKSIPVNPEKRDTFRLMFGNPDIPESTFTLSWQRPEELRARCDSMYFTYIDPLTSNLKRVDMFVQSSLHIQSAAINGGQIFITIFKFGCNIVDAVGDGIDNLP